MTPELIVGLIAACLTTVAFAPQAIQTIRTRNTDGISLSMYMLFVTGVSVWLIYGLMVSDTAIIVANFFTLILASSVLTVKFRNTRKDRKRH